MCFECDSLVDEFTFEDVSLFEGSVENTKNELNNKIIDSKFIIFCVLGCFGCFGLCPCPCPLGWLIDEDSVEIECVCSGRLGLDDDLLLGGEWLCLKIDLLDDEFLVERECVLFVIVQLLVLVQLFLDCECAWACCVPLDPAKQNFLSSLDK